MKSWNVALASSRRTGDMACSDKSGGSIKLYRWRRACVFILIDREMMTYYLDIIAHGVVVSLLHGK